VIKQPVAVGLILCEQVIVEENTRNVTLVNCFTRVRVRDFPAEWQRLAVLAVLTDGLGEATVSLTVSRQDTLEEVFTQENQVRFADPLQEVRILFRLNRVSFPVPGPYQVTLLLDNELVAHRVIQVVAREEES
jgi:hypothetical protein